MRLPDTVNTKPERGGVVAVITEFHPDRRYPLSAFEWLAVKPGKSNGKQPIGFSGNGHAPLPQVTLDYLSHGASNGNRNRALFDAACQFRDAGYSQAEAEAELDSAPCSGWHRKRESGSARTRSAGNNRQRLQPVTARSDCCAGAGCPAGCQPPGQSLWNNGEAGPALAGTNRRSGQGLRAPGSDRLGGAAAAAQGCVRQRRACLRPGTPVPAGAQGAGTRAYPGLHRARRIPRSR